MNRITKGLVAGFAATIVLSVLMVLKTAMGTMPELNLIVMLTGTANSIMGTPLTAAVGWVVHFTIGVVLYGFAFAFLHNKLPGHSETVKCITLGIIGWVIMMVVLMPIMGQGFFALNLGIIAPIMTLILHIIFGVVLGWTYAKLSETAAHHRPAHA